MAPSTQTLQTTLTALTSPPTTLYPPPSSEKSRQSRSEGRDARQVIAQNAANAFIAAADTTTRLNLGTLKRVEATVSASRIDPDSSYALEDDSDNDADSSSGYDASSHRPITKQSVKPQSAKSKGQQNASVERTSSDSLSEAGSDSEASAYILVQSLYPSVGSQARASQLSQQSPAISQLAQVPNLLITSIAPGTERAEMKISMRKAENVAKAWTNIAREGTASSSTTALGSGAPRG
jgi:hypothetical protein